MSSPKGAAAKAARRPTASVKTTSAKPKLAVKVAAAKPKAVANNELSADAIRLAAKIERAFAKSDDAISVEAMQALMGALCRVYTAQVENGAKYTPIAEGQVVSPTGVIDRKSTRLNSSH